MSYQEIKIFINTYIIQNGVNAITGARLNTALNALADYNGFDAVVVTTLPGGSDATVNVQGRTLQLGIPRGEDGENAMNPFKGWFTTDNIPTTGQEGDYCNVSNTSVTPHTVTIYRWSTAQNAFVDTGEVPDTATGETFASGETLQEVAIDDSHLVNPVNTADPTKPVLAKADDVMQMKAKLEGVTAEESQVDKSSLDNYIFPVPNTIKTGYYDINGVFCPSRNNMCIKISVSGYTSMRFLGIVRTSAPSAGQPCYCFLDANDGVIAGSLAEYDIDDSLADNTIKEYNNIAIPNGAVYALLLWVGVGGLTESNFYCYLKRGDNVVDLINIGGYFYKRNVNITEDILSTIRFPCRIQASTNMWQYETLYASYIIDIESLRIKSITIKSNSENFASFAFLKTANPIDGQIPDYCDKTGLYIQPANETLTYNIPNDAKYLYVFEKTKYITYETVYFPESITVEGKYYQIGINEKLTSSPGINYFEVDVNTNVLPNGSSEESNIDNNTTVKSAFGVRFPANYTPDGEPCRVMAMFHGYQGYVTPNVLGYTNTNGWVDFQDVFVDAGFVVFDINGYGLDYNITGNDNHHWGGPGAILTAKKAFEFIKKNYNVKDQMVVFGFSMGGQMGFSYAMNYPEDVIAVALHEPAPPTNNGFLWSLNDINKQTFADAYGYTDWNEAIADNFANFVGYSIPLSLQYYSNGVYDASGITSLDLSTTLPDGVSLSGHIDCPIRIWQGEKKNNIGEDRVKKALVENIVTALRNGGSNVTARYCPGLRHSELKQTQYVIDETLYYLNRYK